MVSTHEYGQRKVDHGLKSMVSTVDYNQQIVDHGVHTTDKLTATHVKNPIETLLNDHLADNIPMSIHHSSNLITYKIISHMLFRMPYITCFIHPIREYLTIKHDFKTSQLSFIFSFFTLNGSSDIGRTFCIIKCTQLV